MQIKRPFLSRTPEQLFGEDHPVTKAIQKKVGRNVPRTVWKIVKPSDKTDAIHLQRSEVITMNNENPNPTNPNPNPNPPPGK